MSFTPIPRLGQRAYWRLENANDSSGNARTLSNENTVTFGAAKFSNGALFTNGSPFNKGLDRTSNPFSADRPTNITFSFWFKLTDTTAHAGTSSTLFSLNTKTDTSGMNMFFVYTIAGADITLRVAQLFSGGQVNLTYVTTSEGAWHHYVVIKEGLDFRFYRDTVLLDSDTGSGNEESAVSTDHEFAMGNSRALAGFKANQCKGIIDDFFMEERVWSDSEIRKVYTQYKGFTAL